MGLDVDFITAEKLFAALDGELFGNIHIFTTAVIAFVRIPFGIFVGHYRALGFQDRFTDKILRGDEFELSRLAFGFQLNGLCDFRINLI